MTDKDFVVIRQNFWRVPSLESAFSTWLEGAPSELERLQVIAQAESARAAWAPSANALALAERLKSFVGYRVQIQFWDSCMFALEEEGPFPLNATCRGVILLQDRDFQQGYLELDHAVEQPNLDGYSPLSFLQQRSDSVWQLAPLADLYTIKKV